MTEAQKSTQTLLRVELDQLYVVSDSDDALPAELHIPLNPNLVVVCNNALVRNRINICRTDTVRVDVRSTAVERKATVHVSEDAMEATLQIEYALGWQRGLVTCSPTPHLWLEVVETQLTPDPFTKDEVMQLLARENVCFQVDVDAIESFLAQDASGEIRIAVGQAVEEGKMERYELLVTDSFEKTMVGIIPIQPVLSIRINSKIAVHRPAVPGIAGTDVRGKVVPVPPQPQRLPRLGKGVMEDAEGFVWSARSGRIIETSRLLDVAETLEIDGDLVALEGHIVFDGDVIVRGDVAEGVHISAGGRVFIGGTTSNAQIHADSGIVVSGGAFQSTLEAGTRVTAIRALDVILGDVSSGLTQFVKSVHQVEESLSGHGKSVELSRISTMLLDSKFEHILSFSEQIHAWRTQYGTAISTVTLQWIEALERELLRSRITTVRDVSHWLNWLTQINDKREDFFLGDESDADIQCKYGQNSRFAATGNIVCTGQGFYQCNLTAALGVRVQGVPGVLMGCTVEAGYVEARDIGSQAGTKSTIRLHQRSGYVKANCLHEGTALSIGNSWHHFVSKEMHSVMWP